MRLLTIVILLAVSGTVVVSTSLAQQQPAAQTAEQRFKNIQTTSVDGPVEKLFYDVKTGLLVRRYTATDTPLGKLPLQTDYEDYRAVDGIKQPFLTHWSMPGRIWGRRGSQRKPSVFQDLETFSDVVLLDEIRGQREGLFVGDSRFICSAQAAQEVGARGVEEVVVRECAARAG
jgi:hypothetical protein